MKSYSGTLSLTIVVVVVMYFVIGHNDKNDIELETQRYCSNVQDGVHPDYKEIFKFCAK